MNRALGRTCIGCLDSRVCWVCEGTGGGHGVATRGQCGRCGGSGVCALCPAPLPVQRERAVGCDSGGDGLSWTG